MTPTDRPPTAWPFAAACVVAAACVALSGFHARHTADSLIPVMVSLYGWEPFFWGQDRLGMLLPALAAPVRHPLHNLLVQTGLSVAGVLGGIGVVAYYLDRGRAAPVVAGGGAVLFLLAFPPWDRFNVMNGCQPYLAPLGLALGSIRLAARGGAWRWAAAGVMTALAYWYNAGIGLTVAPLALGRFLLAPRLGPPDRRADRPEFAAAVVLTALGTLGGYLLMSLAPVRGTPRALAAVADWPAGWWSMTAQLPMRFGVFLLVCGLILVAGAMWLRHPGTREAARRSWLGLGLVLAWLAAQIGVMGTLAWVRENDYDIRYLFPGLVALAPAVAAVALAPAVAAFPLLARRATFAAAAAVPLAAVVGYGPPSVGAARAGVDYAAGRWTDDLLAAHCTHVVGDYWLVWPAAFHANLTLADRGDPRVVWAVTGRAKATFPKWSAVPRADTRLGWVAWPDEPPDPDADRMWRWAYPETACVERRATLHVHAPAR